MEAKTGMKHDQRGIDGGWFKPFPTLFQKLESKTKQVSEYKIPRAVFLGSFHNESSMLFDDGLADQYLSEFFKETGRNEYVPDKRLEEISAFFLVYFTYDKFGISGFLNPVPKYYFPIQFLPGVHFRQITPDGLFQGTLAGEWVKSNVTEEDTKRHLFQFVDRNSFE